jgi:sulfate transport system substrate-binding protein
MSLRSRRTRAVAAALAAVASLAAASVATAATKLSLVAYSTPQEAYEAIIPAFQKTPAGKGVTFDQSYGSSGEQSRAVANGLPADVVAFSLAPDVTRLVSAGLVSPSWNTGKYRGIVSNSVVVLTVRKGNPKKIRTWNDLVKPGIDVLVPNWQTSGGAKWDVLAAYGAQRRLGRSDQAAQDYLRALYKNVSVQDKSAREALQTFTQGKGDVLLGYENEAVFAQQKGIPVDYVVPRPTLLIETPVAVIQQSRNVKAAKAFVDFLLTPQVQGFFASKGYRPVDRKILNSKRWRAKFPRVKGLFDIGTLGGWEHVNRVFFDTKNGIAVKVQDK